jgi:hypothetical protein
VTGPCATACGITVRWRWTAQRPVGHDDRNFFQSAHILTYEEDSEILELNPPAALVTTWTTPTA